jgi:hypothetical protein
MKIEVRIKCLELERKAFSKLNNSSLDKSAYSQSDTYLRNETWGLVVVECIN